MFCRIVINRLVMCLLSWVGNKLQEEIPTSIWITYFGVNKQIATVVVQRGKRMHRRQFHWRALRITLLAQHKPLIIIIEIYYTSCCFNGVNYYKYNARTCSKLVRTPTVNMVSAIAMDAKLERSQFTVIYCDFHSPSPRHQLTFVCAELPFWKQECCSQCASTLLLYQMAIRFLWRKQTHSHRNICLFFSFSQFLVAFREKL